VERVLGLGGVFFRSRDPKALHEWYARHLGLEDAGFPGAIFSASAGDQTVWSPFAQDTSYFGSDAQHVMLNFRVRDLDAMLAQLRAAGVDVEDEVQAEENGRFGWARDPEGNRFELWEPAPLATMP
jgi:predicted enzyme related to lactoylglutathione lyase